MKSQRIAAVAAVAAVVLTLGACSAPTKSEGTGELAGNGKTLTVLTFVDALYPQEQKDWFRTVSDAFEKKTGAKVNFETFATANDELTKIQTSALSGQGPDIYSLGSTFTPTAYATRAFVTMTDADWGKVGGRDRFVASQLGLSGPDAKNEIGIPFLSFPMVMAYNKDLLAAAGVDKVPTTWDELTDAAEKVTSGDVHGLAIGYADNFDPWKFIWAMSKQAGNGLVDVETKRASIDDPTVLRAYETYFGWYRDGLVDPASVGWKNAQAGAAFAAGKAAFLPMISTPSRAVLAKSPVADSYAFAVMPTVPPGETKRPSNGVDAASILAGQNLVVAEYSPEKDLAFALIEMITSAEWQVDYFNLFGAMPTNTKASAKVVHENSDLSPIELAATRSVATPFTGAWGDTQLALTNVVVQSLPALQGRSLTTADIKAAVAKAQVDSQTALDRSK